MKYELWAPSRDMEEMQKNTHNKSSFVYFPNQYVVVGRYLLLSTLVNELNEGAK